MNFKNKLKIELLENGMKQYELCRLRGISEATLGRWIRNPDLPQEEQDRLIELVRQNADQRGV